MASFSPSELSQLPTDLLVNIVIPMLARQESPTQELNRWSVEWAAWFAHNRTKRCTDLAGFRPMGRSYHGCHISQATISLASFVVWGASDDMPLNVYLQWESGAEQFNKQHNWVNLMYERRVQRGEVEWEAV